MDKNYWWGKAQEASAILGWFPTVILAQWQWETDSFRSANLLINNNIAGQTWRDYMPESMKGTPRPTAEGGYYIKYDDPVTGYVDFIQKNPRYSNVCKMKTEVEQILEIAARGWAADPHYAAGLIETLNVNKNQGFVLEEDDEMLKEQVAELQGQVQTLLNTAEAHVERINTLESQLQEQEPPDWFMKEIPADSLKGVIDTPRGPFIFWRLVAVIYRLTHKN